MTLVEPPVGLPLILGAFVTGLLGSAHCVGMCGGLVAALSLARGRKGTAGFHTLYHLGRITTYVMLGGVLAWVGKTVGGPVALHGVGRWVLVGADGFVIFAGLAGAGVLRWGNPLDLELPAVGVVLSRCAKLSGALPRGLAAYLLGVVMGFLPCGFLYALLLNAAVSGSPGRGAATMLGFGLGTAPALLAFGGATGWVTRAGRTWMLRAAGGVVVLMGAYNLWRHLGRFLGP